MLSTNEEKIISKSTEESYDLNCFLRYHSKYGYDVRGGGYVKLKHTGDKEGDKKYIPADLASPLELEKTGLFWLLYQITPKIVPERGPIVVDFLRWNEKNRSWEEGSVQFTQQQIRNTEGGLAVLLERYQFTSETQITPENIANHLKGLDFMISNHPCITKIAMRETADIVKDIADDLLSKGEINTAIACYEALLSELAISEKPGKKTIEKIHAQLATIIFTCTASDDTTLYQNPREHALAVLDELVQSGDEPVVGDLLKRVFQCLCTGSYELDYPTIVADDILRGCNKKVISAFADAIFKVNQNNAILKKENEDLVKQVQQIHSPKSSSSPKLFKH